MMTTTVRQMLAGKSGVYSVTPDDTMYDALSLMADRNIGAVVVLVSEVMTTNVICIDPDWTADRCMALMTDKRIRHLPVIEDGQLIGIVSIGDVVRAVVDEQQFTIQSLERYIMSGG
jgi:CBS domain-containing protein